MTETVTIRASHSSDMPSVTAIYRHAVVHGTASFELVPPNEVEMAARRDTILAGGYPYIVAEADGLVAGYAYAGAYRPRPAYRSTVESSVYVHGDFQGRGIGRSLLSTLVEESSRRGFRQMIAVIGDSGHAASIRLHEAVGFEHAGVLRSVGWKHGRWLDSVLMQRALGEGDSRAPRHR
ncbi:N-acetyltransferase family protein [Fodinicurvata sp. EGI_FJ10296]|uniref:GNAT family N-acetyltransferase n=1 Tax=Fodinicurvata sp. EGI_FJ10296 TaxID=3231908 RepID=UPI00345447B5